MSRTLPQTLRIVSIRLKVPLTDLLALLVLRRFVEPGLESVCVSCSTTFADSTGQKNLHADFIMCFTLVAVPRPEEVLALARSLIAGAVLHVTDIFGEVFGPLCRFLSKRVVPFEWRTAVLGADFVVEGYGRFLILARHGALECSWTCGFQEIDERLEGSNSLW